VVVKLLLFGEDIWVFNPSISELQRLRDICSDYAAKHEIAINRNKTIGNIFSPKSIKTCCIKCLPEWCTCTIF